MSHLRRKHDDLLLPYEGTFYTWHKTFGATWTQGAGGSGNVDKIMRGTRTVAGGPRTSLSSRSGGESTGSDDAPRPVTPPPALDGLQLPGEWKYLKVPKTVTEYHPGTISTLDDLLSRCMHFHRARHVLSMQATPCLAQSNRTQTRQKENKHKKNRSDPT